MERKEFDEIIKKINDSGLRTILDVAGIGELSFDAIAFNKELEEKGFGLTSYYGPNFSRCWGIYEKINGRPSKVKECIIYSAQYFRAENRTTKKCGGYTTLQKLRAEFDAYLNGKKESSTSTRSLPPGFSDSDFEPISIKSIRKTKEGFEIEKKPDLEKEADVTYTYKLINGSFHILRSKKSIITPGGIVVSTSSETLAARAAEHMNIFGEEHTQAFSIVTFLYSNIDFFEDATKRDLDNAILTDLRTDWTFKCPYNSAKEKDKWLRTFGNPRKRKEDFKDWLNGLSKTQTGGVVILGASLNSVNTGYLLSHLNPRMEINKLALYYNKCYHAAHKSKGFYEYYSDEQMPGIFNNFIFWIRNVK